MSDILGYEDKALGTRILRGEDSWKEPSRRIRRVKGAESFFALRPNESGSRDHAATNDVAADKVSINDGADGNSLGDLNQQSRTFKLPRFEITDRAPVHSRQRGSDEMAEFDHALANHSLQHDIPEETSSVTGTDNRNQQNEKFLYFAEIPNSYNDSQAREPGRMVRGEFVPDGAEPVSSNRRYQVLWPRTRHGPGSYRSGYVPTSIAERISAYDEALNPTNRNVRERLGLTSTTTRLSGAPELEIDLRRALSSSMHPTTSIAKPAAALIRHSTVDPVLAYIHLLELPSLEGDMINSRYIQARPLPPVAISYDGDASMHRYISETPVEPSILESIYEDASEEPMSTTSRVKRRELRSYQRMSAGSFIESARNAGEYFRGSSPPTEPAVVPTDLQTFSAAKTGEGPLYRSKEGETEAIQSETLSAEKYQAISSPNGISAKVGTLDQPTVAKRGWLSYKRSLPPKSASSSIYSQPDSRSAISDIGAAFTHGKQNLHPYERPGYQHEDSKGAFETISLNKFEKGGEEAGAGSLTRSSEPKSPCKSTRIKRPISHYTALFTRRAYKRGTSGEDTTNGSILRVWRRMTPSKLSQLERFSRKFRPGPSKGSLKNMVSANNLTWKDVTFEEFETNSTTTEKPTPAIAEKAIHRGPANWFEGALSFHKKDTAQSRSLFTNRRSDLGPNEKLTKSKFMPYGQNTKKGGSVSTKEQEDAETLMMMIEDLKRRLDEALYPAHKTSNTVVVVNAPQQTTTTDMENPKLSAKFASILQSSRYMQRVGSYDDGVTQKSVPKPRFRKASRGNKHGAMIHDRPFVESGLHRNETDNVSWRMSGALPLTSAAPFSSAGASNLEPSEPKRDIFNDILSDNAMLNPPGNAGFSSEASDSEGYGSYSTIKSQRQAPQKTAHGTNIQMKTAVGPRTKERELSKERILRFVKAHKFPPVLPRQSSRPTRFSLQRGDTKPDSHGPVTNSTSRSPGTRSLRGNTSMDGAQEADDEMESDTEIIVLRHRRNKANMRRRRISHEEACQRRSLQEWKENSSQVFDWSLHDAPTPRLRWDRESHTSTDTQIVFHDTRQRRYGVAGDLSVEDERLVTVAAGFSVAFIFILINLYIVYGPPTKYFPAV